MCGSVPLRSLSDFTECAQAGDEGKIEALVAPVVGTLRKALSRVSAPARGRGLLPHSGGATPSGIAGDERVDQAFEPLDAATRHAEPPRLLLDGRNRSRKHRPPRVPHGVRVPARAQKRQRPLTDAVCRTGLSPSRYTPGDEGARPPCLTTTTPLSACAPSTS